MKGKKFLINKTMVVGSYVLLAFCIVIIILFSILGKLGQSNYTQFAVIMLSFIAVVSVGCIILWSLMYIVIDEIGVHLRHLGRKITLKWEDIVQTEVIKFSVVRRRFKYQYLFITNFEIASDKLIHRRAFHQPDTVIFLSCSKALEAELKKYGREVPFIDLTK